MKAFTHIHFYVTRNFLVWLMLLLPVVATAQQTTLPDLLQKAREAGIEEVQLEKIRSSAEEHGLSNQQLTAFIEPALRLTAKNLPSEAIFSKAMEGLSKGVSANRIVPVLQNIENATVGAASITDSWIEQPDIQNLIAGEGGMPKDDFRNEMIKSVSRSFTSDIPAETVSGLLQEIASEEVLSGTTPQSVVSAVAVFPDLSTTAENPEVSRSFVIRSLKSGFTASEFHKLPGAISIAQKKSQLPAANIIEGISNQLRNDIPAKQILQNLINGNVGGGPPGGLPKGLDGRGNQGGNGG